MLALLRSGLTELGLDSSRAEELSAFASLVLERNRVMNLTAITEEADFARLHLLDSAFLLRAEDFRGKRVIDVGAGAGFPGVPLRILEPDFDLTLLDSLGKRVDFLREACEALSLQRVECVHARAEEYASAHRERFDIATARAVASLPLLCELALPLVRVGGVFLAMKSTSSDEELRQSERAIKTLGAKAERSVDYTIPGSDICHRLIVLRKIAPTPKNYPRPFAKIKKNPL